MENPSLPQVYLSKETRSYAPEKRAIQCREIVKYLINGLSYEDIAREMGLDRKTVYNIRQTLEFEDFFSDILDVHMSEIDALSKSKTAYERIHSLQERGKMLRAVVPHRMDVRSLHINVELSERRMKNQAILDALDVETQKKIFEAMLTAEKVGGRGMDADPV